MEVKRKVKERKPYGFFSKMGDKELLDYCFSLYGKDIYGRELRRKDKGMYGTLENRGLLRKIRSLKRPTSLLKDWGYIEKNLKRIIKQNNGELPSKKRLQELGYGGLVNGIKRYHGGINTVRQRRGYELIRKPNGHYKDWKVFEIDMKKVIKQNNGEFPTQQRLYEMKKSCLVGAIRHHGGFYKVKKKMNYELGRKPDGHYKDWKVFEKDMKDLIKSDNNKFPTQKRLCEMGRGSLIVGARYHGGFPAVRKKMGFDLLRKPKFYYKPWKVFERDMKKAIAENKGEFPTQKRLKEMNHFGLLAATKKYHGGFIAVRKKMGFEIIKKPNGYYKPWKVFEKEMKKVIEENGREFPSRSRLREMGYSNLDNAIWKYHGSIAAVREKIGYNEQIRIKLAKKLEEVVERMVG